MESSLGPLLPLFERERAAGKALAVGLLVHTAGSTYRKPGAMMMIAANGDYAGLISGGCLEGDLRQHALTVIETGTARLVTYDMRGDDDLIWGLGLGCEGAMQILLFRVGPDTDWQPLSHLIRCLSTRTPTAAGIVVHSTDPQLPVGSISLLRDVACGARSIVAVAATAHTARDDVRAFASEARADILESARVEAALQNAARSGRPEWVEGQSPDWRLFALPLTLPPQILVLGGGPDAAPVVDLAARQSWKVTVVDHRTAYARAEHFPAAQRVVLVRPEELAAAIDLPNFAAAVVMSHHLPCDLDYLRSLAATRIPYVGLLGPPARRERLLADLGPLPASLLRPRLHAPIGLALGGRTPESIALAIIAEIHAFIHLGETVNRKAERA